MKIDRQSNVQRFECRPLERWVNDLTSERSELSGSDKFEFERDVWMAYSMMIEDGPPITTQWCAFGQWHATEDAGDISASPPFTVSIDPATQDLMIDTRGSAAQPLLGIPAPVIHWRQGGMRGRWHDFVFRMRFSWQGTGQLQAWLNGQQIVNVAGIRNAYNDAKGPYWKYGIYRGQSASAQFETVVAHYANMEIGYSSLAGRILRPLHHPYR